MTGGIGPAAFVLLTAAAGSVSKASASPGSGWLDWLEGAVAFVVILGILVFVHEFGHFAAAKLAGIRVDEFAFGFGPRKLRLFKRGDTEYTIHPFPLGGFVKLAGMEPGDPDTPDGFNSKPIFSRMAVILAGPMMNMVLALVLFTTMGFTVGTPVPGVTVETVTPGSEAARIGLRKADVITRIDGQVMLFSAEAVEYIHKSLDKPIRIDVLRGDRETTYTVTPQLATPERLQIPPDKVTPELRRDLAQKPFGVIGFQAGQEQVFRRTSVGESLSNGFTYTLGTTKMMLTTIFGRIGGAAVGAVPVSEVKKEVGGPIAIFFVVKASVEKGLAMMILLIALLSVNLGVVNVLPIPVLDGGHLALLAVEAVRRKRLSPEKQMVVQWVGLTILLVLMVAIFYNDISRISMYTGGK